MAWNGWLDLTSMGLEQKSQKNSLRSSNVDGWMAAAVHIETQTVVMPVGTTLAHDSRVIVELPASQEVICWHMTRS